MDRWQSYPRLETARRRKRRGDNEEVPSRLGSVEKKTKGCDQSFQFFRIGNGYDFSSPSLPSTSTIMPTAWAIDPTLLAS
jgi:hypothetical protein